jgi:hypothetical protein
LEGNDDAVAWAQTPLTTHLLNQTTNTSVGFGNGRFVIAGRRVAAVFRGPRGAGVHRFRWTPGK